MAARKPTTSRPTARNSRTMTPKKGEAAKKPSRRTPAAAAPKKKKTDLTKREPFIEDDTPKVVHPKAEPLTGKQRRQLRALGHHLEPVVIIGQQGVTSGVISAIEQALSDHELIKVKINEGPADRKEAAEQLAEATGAALAQVLGRTALLYRPDPEDPKIEV